MEVWSLEKLRSRQSICHTFQARGCSETEKAYQRIISWTWGAFSRHWIYEVSSENLHENWWRVCSRLLNFQKFLANISNLDLKVWTNERISAPNGGYFNLFVLPYIFSQTVSKNVNEQLNIHWVGYVHFSVFFRTISWTNKRVLSF